MKEVTEVQHITKQKRTNMMQLLLADTRGVRVTEMFISFMLFLFFFRLRLSN